jgi:hypothetical protein
LHGTEAILTLRALIRNGDFPSYWAFHLTRVHTGIVSGITEELEPTGHEVTNLTKDLPAASRRDQPRPAREHHDHRHDREQDGGGGVFR